MCDPISATIGAALIGAGASVYTGEKARKQQAKASKQAETRAANSAKQQEVETNRANARSPDITGIMDANRAAASGGVGSTMLTGPMGVDMSAMQLGRTSLLGS